MSKNFKHILSGASSLLDISGHYRVAGYKGKSKRVKGKNPFYTLPSSDSINICNDWAIIGDGISKSTKKLPSKKNA